MKEKLEFDYLKKMDDVVQKACICYHQVKHKNEGPKGGVNRKGRNLIPNRQAKFVNCRNVEQKCLSKFPVRIQTKVAYSENRQSEGASKLVNDQKLKPSLQCWGCREPHYYKNCLHKARTEQLSNMQEASTVKEVVRSMLKINVALDDHQAEYQHNMIECEGTIAKKSVSILFDLGASLSYVSPKVVEKCTIKQ